MEFHSSLAWQQEGGIASDAPGPGMAGPLCSLASVEVIPRPLLRGTKFCTHEPEAASSVAAVMPNQEAGHFHLDDGGPPACRLGAG
ncbi:protein of unknown function [Magnetospirillum gryphiswaldense MSR-1 v2]|uniref:Uncharacterized protein n=1 Tax=Magnetospirillum gryphiswaldense (strain DSM 6361 / JCM 21280 / NBRC 15271 / MSR-1) TaxID=431944 RepID=V6EXA0_MAGGM|nr:protein of unknown function [Magnetospirillum gryphiswaldense MSR-1 v2]